MNKSSRRDFLKTGAAAGFFISASSIYGQTVKAGDQKLRVLKVGVGGMGGCDIGSLKGCGAIMTGLCDTDPIRLKGASNAHKGVPFDTDYRKILEKHAKEFDAVCISTPDHTHAVIALEAMRLGKHVYVQKPLAHSFEECEILMEAERKYKVVTQMGNQGHPGVYRYDKLFENNFWGDILEVHGWTESPANYYPQGMTTLPPAEKTPDGYNWDCWLGPAVPRPFSSAYAPFKWRGWRDFGNGAIGDWAVHNLDVAFWAFGLGLPKTVRAWVDHPSKVAFPQSSTVDMRFGPTPKCPNGLNVYWYENGILPKPPSGVHPDFYVHNTGTMVVGSKVSTIAWSHAAPPVPIALTGRPYGKEVKDAQKECGEILKPGGQKWEYDHYAEWVNACKANDPTKTSSRFAYSGVMTQALLLGAIAQFFPRRILKWDAEKKQFDLPEANVFLKKTDRPGFEVRL